LNCDFLGNRHADGDRDGHTDRHSYTYSYGDSKANTDSEGCAHTEASPDPAAASITGKFPPSEIQKQPNKLT
jgi:hypothetical protein